MKELSVKNIFLGLSIVAIVGCFSYITLKESMINSHVAVGNSMFPKSEDGDYYLSLKKQNYEVGDEIVISSWGVNTELEKRKRIIAKGDSKGVKVVTEGDDVYIDGELLKRDCYKEVILDNKRSKEDMTSGKHLICKERNYEISLNEELKKNEGFYKIMKMTTFARKEFILKDGDYFVLGDNRRFSSDSREYGIVKEEQILSKVIVNF